MKRFLPVVLLSALALHSAVAVAKDEPVLYSLKEPLDVTSNAKDYSLGIFGLKMVVDVDIRATFSQTAGEADAPAGIAFWAADPDNFYVAAIQGDGKLFVFRREAGKWSTLVAQSAKDAVRTGLETENELRVVTQGTKATIYVNDKQSVPIIGSPPEEGSLFGVYAESGSRPYTFRFSDYRVLMAPKPSAESEIPDIQAVEIIWPGKTPEERKVNATLYDFAMAVRVFQDEMHRMPRTVGELISAPADAKPGQWHGIYQFRDGLPLDPWGRPYRMRSPGRYATDFVDLWSAGPDGRDATADDIGNWRGGTDEVRIVNNMLTQLASASFNFTSDMKRPLRSLDELSFAPADGQGAQKWSGPYLLGEGSPKDPWGHPYRLRVPSIHDPEGADFWSAGPDGVDGTSDDIGSWMQEKD